MYIYFILMHSECDTLFLTSDKNITFLVGINIEFKLSTLCIMKPSRMDSLMQSCASLYIIE